METRLLLAPYTLAAWLNSRWWTRRRPAPDAIADGVFIGRMPTRREMTAAGFKAMVDLCAELPAPTGPWRHHGLPWLDLVAPEARELRAAADAIEAARGQDHGGVLVCCALGYSRSAAAVAAWLLRSGRAKDVDEAVAMVAARRPGIVLGEEHRRALAALHREGALGIA